MLIAAGAYLGVLIATNLLIIVWIVATGNEFEPEDVGDAFEKANVLVRYADERLAAAASDRAFPELPHLLADQESLRLGLIVTMFSQVAAFTIVGIMSKQSFSELVGTLGLNRFSWRGMWVPVAAVVGAYVATVVYIVAMQATGIDLLTPESTVPVEITRDDFTLSVAAAATVVGAPLSEELFFRGFVFAGLLRWGFWPAVAVSSLGFSIIHLDPGSVVLFFGIGATMAWLFYRRGSLWDAIVFHFLFNFTSFALLAAGR